MEIRELVLLKREPEDLERVIEFFNAIKRLNVEGGPSFYSIEITLTPRKDMAVKREFKIDNYKDRIRYGYFYVRKIEWAE